MTARYVGSLLQQDPAQLLRDNAHDSLLTAAHTHHLALELHAQIQHLALASADSPDHNDDLI